MTVDWNTFKYYCPKCFNCFLLGADNKEYNVEVKCPKCGFILREKQQEAKINEKQYGDSYGEQFRKYEEKIAKAKRIIKNLMVFAEMDDREYESEYKEAEQFLREE